MTTVSQLTDSKLDERSAAEIMGWQQGTAWPGEGHEPPVWYDDKGIHWLIAAWSPSTNRDQAHEVMLKVGRDAFVYELWTLLDVRDPSTAVKRSWAVLNASPRQIVEAALLADKRNGPDGTDNK